tara:strand:+ start:242 stop:448 length:207 start_codon:yes stop_codon:yes gene_type:complete
LLSIKGHPGKGKSDHFLKFLLFLRTVFEGHRHSTRTRGLLGAGNINVYTYLAELENHVLVIEGYWIVI